MKKKKPKGYKAGGVTQQELAEMKALAKKSGKSGPDQPLLERRKSLKGKKRNVSPEEIRARKKEKEKKMGGGGMFASKLEPKKMGGGGRASRGRGSATLANQRGQRATGTRIQKMGGMPGLQSMQANARIGMEGGGKLPMVEQDGKMVPFFAADGVGKMQGGGPTPPKTKGYFKGGRTMSEGGETATKTKAKGGAKVRGSGAARKQKFSKNG